MVPVRDAGQDHALEVGEDGVERFAVLGRAMREGRRESSPGCTRDSTGISIGSGEVVGDPVRDPVRFPAEGLRIHVAEGSMEGILSGLGAQGLGRSAEPVVERRRTRLIAEPT